MEKLFISERDFKRRTYIIINQNMYNDKSVNLSHIGILADMCQNSYNIMYRHTFLKDRLNYSNYTMSVKVPHKAKEL